MIKNLFLSVFEASLQVSLIVLILIVAAPLLNKRYRAKWKYFIWIVLALRLAVPLQFSFPARPFLIPVPAEITVPIADNGNAGIPIQLQPVQSHTPFTMLDIAAAVWLAGCLLFLTIHIFSCLHYKRQIRKKGVTAMDPVVIRLLLTLRKELQLKHGISVTRCADAGSPMIIGFIKPLLVLPELDYNQEELYFILKHELIHYKRHDIFVKLLFVAANALHWFNPMIYIMRKEAVIDMELACDEMVIQGTPYAAKKAYTETLFSTLHKQQKKAAALTTQFYGGTRIMKKRFKHILYKAKKKNGFPILTCAIVLTLFLGLMTGCAVTAPPAADPQNPPEAPANSTEDSIEAQQTTGSVPESETNEGAAETLSADAQEIKNAAESFASAYFSGDANGVKTHLISPYEWDVDVYTGSGAASDFTLKGLPDSEKEIGSVQVISLEYRDSDYEDMFLYLTMEFVKQEDGWKIQFYGVEG